MQKPAATLAAIALTAALSACDRAHAPSTTGNETEAGANDAATNDAGTQPADDAGAATGEMPATITAAYDCKPAMAISVVYDNRDAENPMARVTVDGAGYDMAIARSASGARYVAGKGRGPGTTLIWWNKGNDGTLLEGRADAPDAADETVIATCTGRD